ncbi:hypothetical protein TrST_g11942 [Triparma strigata]|uniref:GRIP domain-containing protein n=1 Tax=Triparma strigata TaxID=1606541 RepID=A0A9W7BPA9_9STRA|nr:hypothetical protein TrST_g11942 [Triparma strigata]
MFDGALQAGKSVSGKLGWGQLPSGSMMLLDQEGSAVKTIDESLRERASRLAASFATGSYVDPRVLAGIVVCVVLDAAQPESEQQVLPGHKNEPDGEEDEPIVKGLAKFVVLVNTALKLTIRHDRDTTENDSEMGYTAVVLLAFLSVIMLGMTFVNKKRESKEGEALLVTPKKTSKIKDEERTPELTITPRGCFTPTTPYDERDERQANIEDLQDKNDELAATVEDLQAKYALLEGSLSQTLKKKQEQAIRSAQKMIQMMKGKALTSTFVAWYAFTREAKEDCVKMEKFLAKWKNQNMAKCYMAWTQYVTEEKRYRYLVNRFLQRLNNGVAFRIFAAWVSMVEEKKRNKIIIARFRIRMLNIEVAKSLGSWKEFVNNRLRLKYLARRIINRCENGRLLSAWIPWVESTIASREIELKVGMERAMQVAAVAQRDAVDERLRLLKEMVSAEKDSFLEKEKNEAIHANEIRALKAAEVKRKKVQGLNTWKQFVAIEKKDANHAKEKSVLLAKINSLEEAEAERKSAQGLRSWRERVESEKRKRISRVRRTARLCLSLLSSKCAMAVFSAFKTWHLLSKEDSILSVCDAKLEFLKTKMIGDLSNERLDKWKRNAVAEMHSSSHSALHSKLDEMLLEVGEVEKDSERKLHEEIHILRRRGLDLENELERARVARDHAEARMADVVAMDSETIAKEIETFRVEQESAHEEEMMKLKEREGEIHEREKEKVEAGFEKEFAAIRVEEIERSEHALAEKAEALLEKDTNEKRLQEEVEQLQTEYQAAKDQLADLKANHDAQETGLLETVLVAKDQLAQIKAAHEAEVDDLKVTFASRETDLQQAVEEALAKATVLEQDSKAKVDNLKETFESRETALLESISVVKDQLAQLKADHEAKIDDLSRENASDGMRHDLFVTTSKVNEKNLKEEINRLEKAKAEHGEELEVLRTEKSSDRMKYEKFVAASKANEEKLHEEIKMLESAKEAHEEQLQGKLSEIIARHEEELETVRSLHASDGMRFDLFVATSNVNEKTLKDEIKRLKDNSGSDAESSQLREELDALKSEYSESKKFLSTQKTRLEEQSQTIGEQGHRISKLQTSLSLKASELETLQSAAAIELQQLQIKIGEQDDSNASLLLKISTLESEMKGRNEDATKLVYVRNVVVRYMEEPEEEKKRMMEAAILEAMGVGEEERGRVLGRGGVGGWLGGLLS